MNHTDTKGKPVESKPIHVRKLTKSGGSSYLSVGKIINPEWVNVKIVVEEQDRNGCLLRVTPIR